MSALQQLIKNTHTTVGENIEPKTLVDIMTGQTKVQVKKEEQPNTPDYLNEAEVYAAKQLGYSPSEYRRFQAGEMILEPMKESRHWQIKKKYDEEWAREDEIQHGIELGKQAKAILKAKQEATDRIKAQEKKKAEREAKEAKIKQAQAELLSEQEEPDYGIPGYKDMPSSKKNDPNVISSVWDE